jgi:hypothetical protein
MIPALKVLSLAVAAAGAAVALWGNARDGGRFTRAGFLAISLLIIGLGLSAVIEVLQFRQERAERVAAQLHSEMEDEWQMAQDQPISTYGLALFERREQAAGTFVARAGEIEIYLVPQFETSGEPGHERLLKFTLTPNNPNVEAACALSVAGEVTRVPLARSEGCTLMRNQPLNPSSKSSAGRPTPRRSRVFPNDKSAQANLRSAEGVVVGMSFVTNGWHYTSSAEFDWSDATARACGVRGRLAWSTLQLGAEFRTVSALRHLRTLRVVLPNGRDFRIVDMFELTLLAGDDVFTLDLRDLTYAQREDGKWQASIKGREIESQLKAQFAEAFAKRESAKLSYLAPPNSGLQPTRSAGVSAFQVALPFRRAAEP